MPLFRRKRSAKPDPQADPPPTAPPPSRYADSVTVVVRHSSQPVMTIGREFDVATVIWLAPGGDGEVPAEEIRDDTFRWIVEETEFGSANEVVIRRVNSSMGASGAEVMFLLSLLGGAAGGASGKVTERALDFIVGRLDARAGGRAEILDQGSTPEALKYAVARAFDLRSAELQLVERRSSDRHDAAVFEDRDGQFYGVRIEDRGALTIRRLQEGDW